VAVCSGILVAGLLATAADGQWTAPVNLSQSDLFTEEVCVAVDGQGRAHVVYGEGGQLLHRYGSPGSWSPATTVAAGFAPALAADEGGQVHLAFVNHFADVDDVFYLSWQEGTGWQLPVNVSEGLERSSSPSLDVAPDGSITVAWGSHSGDLDLVYVAESSDGVLWSSGPVPHAFGARPKVAIVDGDLLVAWQGPYDVPGSAMEVFVSRRSNQQWSLPLDVSASPDVDSVFCSLTHAAGRAYLAWQEDGTAGPAANVSMEDGGDWSLPQKQSGDASAHAPAIAVDGDSGHLAWTTDTTVQHRSWALSTGAWQAVTDVAVGQAGARDVGIALDGLPLLAWLAEAGTNNDDVFYSTRVSGATPTPTEILQSTPSQTVTQTATATPSLAATVVPSRTPTSTVAPSRTPTSTATHPAMQCLFLPIVFCDGSPYP
jgi:hypothetical protein